MTVATHAQLDEYAAALPAAERAKGDAGEWGLLRALDAAMWMRYSRRRERGSGAWRPAASGCPFAAADCERSFCVGVGAPTRRFGATAAAHARR